MYFYHSHAMKNMEMDLKTVKEATLRFYRKYYAEQGDPPSVKLAWREVEGLTKRNFYVIFKGGQAEVCTLAGIPVPEDRIKTTSRAREEREKAQKPPGKLEEEIQAEAAEAALEVEKKRKAARERKRKAEVERLRLEAMRDPGKLLSYMKTLAPELTAPFFEICKSAELTPRRGWSEAVKVRGENWAEWGLALKAGDEEPCLKAYIADVIEVYIPQKRLELAKERRRGKTYSCICGKCGLRYEFQDKKAYTLFTCPNGCIQDHGGVESVYPCPVCEELGNRSNLVYDRSQGMLHCKVCGFKGAVRDDPLNPKGTKAGAFRHPIDDLKAEKVRLTSEVSSLRGSKADLVRKREKEERSLAKLRAEMKREDRELDAVRDEKAKERRLRDSLKRETNRGKRKREIYNGMAEFLTNPEMVDGSAIDDIIRTLEVARDLRKKPGHVGEAMKMTVEVRGKLLSKIAGKDFILTSQADRIREREIDKLKAEYDRKLKVKDDTINVERRRRETAEREREALAPWRDEDMDKLRRENRRLRDRNLALEGENSDLRSKLHLQRLMSSS